MNVRRVCVQPAHDEYVSLLGEVLQLPPNGMQ
jgi:hypothetical protein